jgi:hypothetical protein
MNLIFERGRRDAPVGHALVYFQADTATILATYVSVPPIEFNLTKYVPGFLASAMQGMGSLGDDTVMVVPMPPIPEEVPSVEYLRALAARRNDDLVYAGGTMLGDPMRLAADASEAARDYGDLYRTSPMPEGAAETAVEPEPPETVRFVAMSEREQLHELTALTGRLRDSLMDRGPDEDVERQMRQLAALMPAKYRAGDLVDAARIPGERGQHLAALYLERCYKLYNEEYLDLERIDREIDALDD